MSRATTPSFVCELPLITTPADERKLLVRLDVARMVYNACLGEALSRLTRVRSSTEYKTAVGLPRRSLARRTAFRNADQRSGLSEYSLHEYAKQFSHAWLGQHLDVNTIQKLATRSFLAVRRYACSKAGKPRFKGKGWFDSVEGKSNTQGIIWRNGMLKWKCLEIRAAIPVRDPVVSHALSCRIKFVRIVRRKLNGRDRFFVQLVCEGRPYHKPKHILGQGVVGLDVGPSMVAIVSDQAASLRRFCDELKPKHKRVRRLERKLDRQRRANNPSNYDDNSTRNPGTTDRHLSNRYLHTRSELSELHRKEAAHRKTLHGAMINQILALGNVIRLERISYHWLQLRFGKSVRHRGPGLFISHLRRKAANAGATMEEFDPRLTRLSQVCLCGAIRSKPLELRWHSCECGVGPIQRDLFSAWLARFVVKNHLDVDQAKGAWSGVDARLRAASREIQLAMGLYCPPTLERGQSQSSAQSVWLSDEALESLFQERVGLAIGTSGA